MPDDLRAVIEELRRRLIRRADVLSRYSDDPRLGEFLADRASDTEMLWRHLPALLDAAKRGLEAEERKQKALKLMARKRAPGLRSPVPPREGA